MITKRHASEVPYPQSDPNNPPQAKKKKVTGSSQHATIRDVQKPVKEHHAFSFEFDGNNLLCRSGEKCSELVWKASGYLTRLPKYLHESETFAALSRSMVQSIGYNGQTYLRYKRNLAEADNKVDSLFRENLDLEMRALEAKKALQKTQEDLKTSRNEENLTYSRLFNENSRDPT